MSSIVELFSNKLIMHKKEKYKVNRDQHCVTPHSLYDTKISEHRSRLSNWMRDTFLAYTISADKW